MAVESTTELVLCSNSPIDIRLLRRALPKILEFLQNWNKIKQGWDGIGLTHGRWLCWDSLGAYENRYPRGIGFYPEYFSPLPFGCGIMLRLARTSIFTPIELEDYVQFDQIETSFPSSISTEETMTRWDDIGLRRISYKSVVPEIESNTEGGETGEETEEETGEETEEPECCIICAEELDSRYCAEMPCCGARIHTRCFTNCIANTIGTEVGNTREQCIFCRTRICDPIKLDCIMEERLISLRASAAAGWEEAENQADARRENEEECYQLLQIEKGNFARLEGVHIKLRIDYEGAVLEAAQRKKTIKKLRRGVKGKRKLLKEKVAVQNALREEKRLRHEERYVRCMHIGCSHKPFKLDMNRQSKAYEEHVKRHLMRELMSSVSIESNIKLNSRATKCQSLVRGYTSRKAGLYRFWKLLNSI